MDFKRPSQLCVHPPPFLLSCVCMYVYRVEYRWCVNWFILIKDDSCPGINPREAAHLLFGSDSKCDIPLSICTIVWREETNTRVNWRFTCIKQSELA